MKLKTTKKGALFLKRMHLLGIVVISGIVGYVFGLLIKNQVTAGDLGVQV